jgi:hypothetical protein
MTTRWRSTKANGGAPMGRWFWTRGGEIEAEVTAIDNGDALVTPFIGSSGDRRRAVKDREAAAVELQWR